MTKSELQLVRAVSLENSRLRAALQLIAQHVYGSKDYVKTDYVLRIIATSYSAGAA